PHIARNACNNSKPNDNHQWLAQLPQRNGKLNAIPLADRGCPTYKAISERPSDPFQINGVNLTSKEIFTAEMRKSEPNQQYRQQSDPYNRKPQDIFVSPENQYRFALQKKCNRHHDKGSQ